MPEGSIITRKGELEAKRHADRLRAAVEKRAAEKGVTLAEALLEIQSEGKFHAANAERDAQILNRQREKDGCVGWGRDAFSRKVAAKALELMSRDRDITALAAYRNAAEIVARTDPKALSDYRSDVVTMEG